MRRSLLAFRSGSYHAPLGVIQFRGHGMTRLSREGGKTPYSCSRVLQGCQGFLCGVQLCGSVESSACQDQIAGSFERVECFPEADFFVPNPYVNVAYLTPCDGWVGLRTMWWHLLRAIGRTRR